MYSYANWKQNAATALPSLLLLALIVIASQLPVPFLGSSLPLLPALTAIYYWSLFRPSAVPLWVIAPLSLLHDALYGLPLGCSLFVFLLMRGLSAWLRKKLMFQHFILAWLVFAPMLLCMLAALIFWQHWTVHIGYGSLLAAYDMPFFLTWLSYPLFHLLFNWCYHQLPPE